MTVGLLHAQDAEKLPNIVLILSDDQGWTGTSLKMDRNRSNSRSDLYETPHLERLAAQGMRFSNGYSPAPNCSPTRMSIQTGKTAARLGATDIIDIVPKGGRRGGFYTRYYVNKPLNVPLPISDLPDEEVTIAEFLQDSHAAYKSGHFGKWHMGGGSPDRHGYDAHSGLTSNREGRQSSPDPKRTSEVTRQALNFISDCTESGAPFFVQVSYYAVHTPIYAKQETLDKYAGKSSRQHLNRAYAAMTDELDQGLGEILDKLEALGINDHTYVIYTSDNGGEVTEGTITNNVPLAKGKTNVWEGGIRVPFVVRGPGIEADSQSDVPVVGYDLLPTIAQWVGSTDKLPKDLDGGSLADVLANGGKGSVERGTPELVWYYGAYRNHKHVTPEAAIRRGRYKLIWEIESDRSQLFDLSLDVSETTDLARFDKDTAKALEETLKSYLKKVGTKLPTRNPNYDPAKDPGLR